MTETGLEEVRSIAQEMRLNLARAVAICRETGKDILDEARHEFWALAKYVENVQEAIVRLDNKNRTILPRLNEFPERSEDRTLTTWKSLKGMRSKLAHKFEDIDHDILWDTVTNQFPILERLLAVLQFHRVTQGQLSTLSLQVGIWRGLPAVAPGRRLDGTNSIPAIVFDHSGIAMCVRFGRIADDKIAISSTAQGFALEGIHLVDPNVEEPPEVLWPKSPRSGSSDAASRDSSA